MPLPEFCLNSRFAGIAVLVLVLSSPLIQNFDEEENIWQIFYVN
ncbi:hypothetical protein [Nitrosospira sp. Nl5]|nr:hypothetical protein [Nitrosospira sp. Nl5]